MDLQKLSGNVNLDNIDQTLNWLEFNQSKNQIENELEELFNFIHSANRKIEAELRKLTSEVPQVDYLCFRLLVESTRFETPSRQEKENIESDLGFESTHHLELLRQAIQKSQLLNNSTAVWGQICLNEEKFKIDFVEFLDDFVVEKQKIILLKLGHLIDKVTLIQHQQNK